MKALTPQLAFQGLHAAEVSLFISIELPNIPSPTTLLPFHDARFRTSRFGYRRRRRTILRCEPPLGVEPRLRCGVRSEVRDLLDCSPTGLAESSSLSLRTARSSPVALHPFC